jgi:antirestriction protein ArdC
MSTYDKITQLIVDKLGQGVVPWRRPWASSHLPPTNLSTLKPYRGINVLLTSMGGWDSPYWLTFNQARDLGANVRKGEKGTPIVFYTKIEKERKMSERTICALSGSSTAQRETLGTRFFVCLG